MTNSIVLLVDDDPGLLQLHQFTLKAKTDYDVYLAASGQAAFEKIKARVAEHRDPGLDDA